MKTTILALLLGFISQIANAEVLMKCGVVQNERFWTRYCLHTQTGSTNPNLLYYFHGHSGSEYEWSNSAYFSEAYARWGNNAPKVLTVSYGTAWLLAEKNTALNSGMLEHFTQFALPTIEKDLNLKPAKRMLFGASMGGYNAAQIYLKAPSLFTKIALACPAINTLAPNANAEDIDAYAYRTGAYYNHIYGALRLMNAYYPGDAWKNQGDTIALAATKSTPGSPALNVSCGDLDEFGFFEGAKKFVDQVRAQGGKAEWKLLHGYHCTVDPVNMAQFFIQ